MTTQKGGTKDRDKKGKRKRKNKPTGKKYSLFTVKGNSISRAKNCPRCGPGIFLGGGQGRLHCGKCNYTEFFGEKKEE